MILLHESLEMGWQLWEAGKKQQPISQKVLRRVWRKVFLYQSFHGQRTSRSL